MIKKRKYKRRRNPKIEEIPLTPREIIYLKYELTKALIGDYDNLANAQKLLKIGFNCTDCNNKYEFCACEWCNDCNSKECFCNLDIWIDAEQYLKSQSKTRKIAWDIIKELFNKQERNQIKENAISLARNSWIIEEIKEITEL